MDEVRLVVRDYRGRIVANWPGYMTEYGERLRVLDPGEFEFAGLHSNSR